MENDIEKGNRLRIELISDYIDKNNITRKEFCKRCGISLSTYYKVMQEKNVRALIIFKIGKTINLPVHKLFGK